MVLKNDLDRDAPGLFPPDLIIQVKAIACELPAKYGLPLSRWSTEDIVRYVQHSGIIASISGSTVWRWLHEDAIKPWQHRCWIFPIDPDFATKAGRILDLYQRVWNGKALKEDEFVVSADEKTSIQARARRHSTYPPQPSVPMKMNINDAELGVILQHLMFTMLSSSVCVSEKVVSALLILLWSNL